MKTPKLTETQRELLERLSRRRIATGTCSINTRAEAPGATLAALVRKGLATRDFAAIFDATYYEITDAGRAALKEDKL